MEISEMTFDEYLRIDEGYTKAVYALDKAYGELTKGSRWGDTRRFSGRSAGLRLERIEKAKERMSKTYDRAMIRYQKEIEKTIKHRA